MAAHAYRMRRLAVELCEVADKEVVRASRQAPPPLRARTSIRYEFASRFDRFKRSRLRQNACGFDRLWAPG